MSQVVTEIIQNSLITDKFLSLPTDSFLIIHFMSSSVPNGIPYGFLSKCASLHFCNNKFTFIYSNFFLTHTNITKGSEIFGWVGFRDRTSVGGCAQFTQRNQHKK